MYSSYDDYDEFDEVNDIPLCWIYIGADIRIKDWSKVGKTTIGLDTRHTSSQNPGYFIFCAFNIIRGNVHEIEKDLHKYLEKHCFINRQLHFSTGSKSECYELNPDEMTFLVEDFISNNYGSCVTYENDLHGEMSRYLCCSKIQQRYRDTFKSYEPNSSLFLNKNTYFPGNKEEYELDLGSGHYQDIPSGRIFFRDDE